MKPTPISVAMLVVSLFLAPALLAQSPDSANQSAASSAASAAEVPRLIKFSGTLLDSQDRPLAGPVGVTFALNAQQTGGAALWMETQNVTPDAHGNYTVLLGANSTNGVPAELFASGEARWLEVQVERQAEQPRILLVSVPYALKAKDAETLGGKPASAYALAGAGVSYVTGTTGTSESSAAATGGTALAASTSGPQPLALTPCASVTSDGTATVNSISKFTTACNVESSAILENGGKVGMGIAPSTSTKLFLVDSQKDFGTAWLQRGVFSSSVTTPGTNHGVAFDLDTTNMLISSGVTDLGYRIGVRALAFASNNPGFAGTLNQQFGLVAQAGIFTAASTAKVTNAYGGQFAIFNQVPGTTITNAYGVYISNSGTGGTITNRYDLYASSPNANNFFAGKVGIGTTTPVANLEVNGTTKFDGLVSFAGGQAFPGTGTVTSVSSGLGLTGGPITGSGTMAINPTVVPQLTASSNTFTGSITANSFTGSGAGLSNVNAAMLNGLASTAFATVGANSFTGNQSVTGNVSLTGNLGLPNTTSGTVGVISLGGTRFAHNFGSANAANTFIGVGAGNFSMSGVLNSAFGTNALAANTTGVQNAAFGVDVLFTNTTGFNNVAFGVDALSSNTTGHDNSAFGSSALDGLTSGNFNIAIGPSAGTNLVGSESNNIYIGNAGAASESNTIRIGNTDSLNGPVQTAAFIAGISVANVSGAPVLVSSSGQLGVAVSSRRFKDDIADMADESDLLMNLRPVSFYYKPELDPTHTRQYGLVAEEVARVSPDLVVFDKDGVPQTVRYHFVNAMLLNEVQKQRQLVAVQQSTIARQQAEIQDLAARLVKLEALVAPER